MSVNSCLIAALLGAANTTVVDLAAVRALPLTAREESKFGMTLTVVERKAKDMPVLRFKHGDNSEGQLIADLSHRFSADSSVVKGSSTAEQLLAAESAGKLKNGRIVFENPRFVDPNTKKTYSIFMSSSDSVQQKAADRIAELLCAPFKKDGPKDLYPYYSVNVDMTSGQGGVGLVLDAGSKSLKIAQPPNGASLVYVTKIVCTAEAP